MENQLLELPLGGIARHRKPEVVTDPDSPKVSPNLRGRSVEQFMKELLELSKDCGVSLSDEDLSREHMYD